MNHPKEMEQSFTKSEDFIYSSLKLDKNQIKKKYLKSRQLKLNPSLT